jgi:hypothetical protein
MDGLSPRPRYNGPLYSWKELNDFLRIIFTGAGEHQAIIDLRDYSMSKDEIVAEATKQGYKVSEQDPYHLKFE